MIQGATHEWDEKETLAVARDPELREAIRRGLHDVNQGDAVDLADACRMLDRPGE